jgi:hypothetical protein
MFVFEGRHFGGRSMGDFEETVEVLQITGMVLRRQLTWLSSLVVNAI